MNEQIPLWLGVLYGAGIVLMTAGPLVAYVWRDFHIRIGAVEKATGQHEQELYGKMGTNGLKGRVEAISKDRHHANNWIAIAALKFDIPYRRD